MVRADGMSPRVTVARRASESPRVVAFVSSNGLSVWFSVKTIPNFEGFHPFPVGISLARPYFKRQRNGR